MAVECRNANDVSPCFAELPTSQKEPNLAREVALLFRLRVEPHHQQKMDRLITAGEVMTDAINRFTTMSRELRDAKKENNYDIEAFRPKIEEFNTWLKESKNQFPDLFKNMHSPFGDDSSKITKKELESKIDTFLEKMQEINATAQGQLSPNAMRLDEAMKYFQLIVEMFSEGLKQHERSQKTVCRNFKVQ